MFDLSLMLDSPPEDWTPAKFSGICKRVQDTALPSPDGTRLYVGLEHIASAFPALTGRGNESEARSGKTAFCKGDVLFGKLRPYLRKSVLAPADGICSTDILVFRATDQCIPEFLCLLTHTDEFIGHAKTTTSGVQHPRTSWASLREFKLHVPPLDEQRRIAGVLGTVQRAVEEQERLLQLTTELKRSLLHKLFTEGLRGEPQKITEIGPVPQSWEVMGFEDFALLQRGFDLPRSAFKNGSVPVVGATTIIGFHNVWNVRGPGVTVVRSGSSAGKPLYIEKDFWAHNVVLFVKDFHGNNPRFVYYKIQSLDLTKYREGVAVPTLNRNSFKTIPVAIPERDEQDEFVRVLDPLALKERRVAQKKDLLTNLFQVLLHQLMTAQIRVDELELSATINDTKG
jgi:type I restriction enzyme S subunit